MRGLGPARSALNIRLLSTKSSLDILKATATSEKTSGGQTNSDASQLPSVSRTLGDILIGVSSSSQSVQLVFDRIPQLPRTNTQFPPT
jgi:hypothetical protein